MYQDAATYNETLTILAQGFRAQAKDSLIDFIAPIVPTGVAQGDYMYFDEDAPFQVYDADLAEEGESKTIHFNATKKQFNCEPKGLKIPITYYQRQQAGKNFDTFRTGKLNTLLSTQAVTREYKGWQKIRAAVKAETGFGAWMGEAGAAKDPIDEIDEMIERINDSTGAMPNSMAIGFKMWRILKNHPRVLGRMSGIDKKVGIDELRDMLAFSEIDIRVGSMPANTTKLGKKAVRKGILGADLFLFHSSASPSTDDMSACKTFAVDASGVTEVHTHDIAIKHALYDEVLYTEDLRITAPIAIRRITAS